ncbi:hypothetical protein C8R46DRAFT_1001822 [Mycena filopes]|nr:hypothetical protein C8R46DRAFT_1009909 [Mycena filopes]KAJ7159573.1 hypothetical protein C8R46DRAFT_1001822 [Mycena filopes]
MDATARGVDEFEGAAIRKYLIAAGQTPAETWAPFVTRWSRLRLPNGQVARSAWKEKRKPIQHLRCARNIKMVCGGRTRFAEVHFYMMFKLGEVRKPLAVVSVYGEHHQQLYDDSSKTYVSMQHSGTTDVRVIDIDCIRMDRR